LDAEETEWKTCEVTENLNFEWEIMEGKWRN
jgi:hypothetical protein